jgi:hypothetical protein
MKLNSLIQKIGDAAFHLGRKTDSGAPPVLLEGTRFPYGPFRFRVQMAKGAVYSILASNDLQNWIAVSKDEARAELTEYVDSEAFKFNYRFYRVVVGEIQSVNVIGYVSVTLPPGFSMIANPLDAPSTTVADMFPNWPEGTTLNRFDARVFRLAENSVAEGVWSNPAEKLLPGEGAIFFNPTQDYKSLSFTGDVMQGNLSVPIPAGFSIHSSPVPQAGNLEDLGFPVANGDVIHLFDRDRQKYMLHPYADGKWTAGPPIVSVGESFWVAKTEAANWARTLFVGA